MSGTTNHLRVATKAQAWTEVNKMFPTDYEKDEASSQRAGYDIYRHNTINPYNRICDLGNRLEVLIGEWGEDVINIWIEQPAAAPVTAEEKRKLACYDRTVEMLENTILSMTRMHRDLSEHGFGSLWRAQNTLEWLKGEQGNHEGD